MDEINGRLDKTEKWFGELKDKSIEIIQAVALLDEIKNPDLQ